MKDNTPRINHKSRSTPCDYVIIWDNESCVLTMSFTYHDENKSEEPTRRDMIDKRFGIGTKDYRIIIGDVELLLNTDQSIKFIEIRSNPSNWQKVSLPNLPDNIEEVSPIFDVDYDENLIDSYDVPLQTMHDVTHRQLAIIFGNHVTSQWVKIANGLLIGVTSDQFMSELRLLDFELSK